ncbi:NAD(P)-binding protein [Aureobasidium sp. EXF-12298]|nr:NAD(P)-binding protein [Aureobasidium sp. EXF-12298]
MATYLITGASRGIGLELTKQLLELPASQVSKVFAVARNVESDGIKQLEQKYADRLYPVSASVDNTASVQKAVEAVKAKLNGQSLDVLVNNAGISGQTNGTIKDMELDQLTQILDVNVVGVQRVTAAFFPLLEQGSQKKIINVSSGLGSFAYAPHVGSMPSDAYIISKTTLNMLTVRWAHQYADAGFTIVAISPGWLKTDMGTEHADLSLEQGVTAVKKLILETGKEHNGRFLNIKVPKTDEMMWDYDGKDIPW